LHASLRITQRQISGNAAFIHSNCGDGIPAHLTIILLPAEDKTFTRGIAFIAQSTNLFSQFIPQTPQLPKSNRQHKTTKGTFVLTNETDKALPRNWFGSVTCFDILTHI
jgi:hypothetical protein